MGETELIQEALSDLAGEARVPVDSFERLQIRRARILRRRRAAAAIMASVLALAAFEAVRPPGRPALPATTPTRQTLSFVGVSLTVPQGWSVRTLSIYAGPDAVGCFSPRPQPTATSCAGGVKVVRQVRVVPPMSTVRDDGTAYDSCEQFGLGSSGVSQDRPIWPRSATSVSTIAGLPTGTVFGACSNGTGFVSWDLRGRHQRLSFTTATPVAPGITRMISDARILDRPLPAVVARPGRYRVPGGRVTLPIPGAWQDWGASTGQDCLGALRDEADLGSLTCPVGGLLIRGTPFFNAVGDGDRPAPATADGYVRTGPSAPGSYLGGCARLAALHLLGPHGLPSQTSGRRTLLVQGTRVVGGERAEYREWSTRCPDGTHFLWRRWWLARDDLMIDSYVLAAVHVGLSEQGIDDLLAQARFSR